MSIHSCETCRMRERYEKRPNSLWGRLWRWHTKWCPGWKAYVRSLSEDEKTALFNSLKSPTS